MYIHHITTSTEAEEAARTGRYVPEAFDADGFVHCSTRDQVIRVANFLFAGRKDLVLLTIDRAALTSEVREENCEGGDELFPHVYGPLPWSAIVSVHPFPCGDDGTFTLPIGLDG